MYSKEIQTRLQNAHILVDTCVISSTFYNPQFFEDFYNFLESVNCTTCINALISLEFLRIAKDKSIKEKIEMLFKEKFFNLPIDAAILSEAKEIYPLFNFCQLVRNKNQISVVDALNVSLLKKYLKNLYFITFDHFDYPLEILDRIFVGVIDTGKEIITWGIYCFNQEKYNKLLLKFNN